MIWKEETERLRKYLPLYTIISDATAEMCADPMQ
jgi:hypothetical protein